MATAEEKVATIDAEKGHDLSPRGTIGDVDVVILKPSHLNDADEAMKAFEGLEADSIVMTPEVERRLLWKIDRNIMPVCDFWLICASNVADGYTVAVYRVWTQLSG
jgi:hypothetical protein